MLKGGQENDGLLNDGWCIYN